MSTSVPMGIVVIRNAIPTIVMVEVSSLLRWVISNTKKRAIRIKLMQKNSIIGRKFLHICIRFLDSYDSGGDGLLA